MLYRLCKTAECAACNRVLRRLMVVSFFPQVTIRA